MGQDGYIVERNTRYGGPDCHAQKCNEWPARAKWVGLRKILETTPDYETAVSKIKSSPFASTEYSIVSGVQKGTIISKAPDSVAHVQELPEGEKNSYIIMTNFDFFFHDIREFFDPTGLGPNGKHSGFGNPSRRKAAQAVLDSASALTPDLLYSTINGDWTIADTVFQLIGSVEKNVWNISAPVF